MSGFHKNAKDCKRWTNERTQVWAFLARAVFWQRIKLKVFSLFFDFRLNSAHVGSDNGIAGSSDLYFRLRLTAAQSAIDSHTGSPGSSMRVPSEGEKSKCKSARTPLVRRPSDPRQFHTLCHCGYGLLHVIDVIEGDDYALSMEVSDPVSFPPLLFSPPAVVLHRLFACCAHYEFIFSTHHTVPHRTFRSSWELEDYAKE
eukprot:4713908-Amphidinium_carterae.2